MTSQERGGGRERYHGRKGTVLYLSTFNGTLFLPFEQEAAHFSFALNPAIYITRDRFDI